MQLQSLEVVSCCRCFDYKIFMRNVMCKHHPPTYPFPLILMSLPIILNFEGHLLFKRFPSIFHGLIQFFPFFFSLNFFFMSLSLPWYLHLQPPLFPTVSIYNFSTSLLPYYLHLQFFPYPFLSIQNLSPSLLSRSLFSPHPIFSV